MVGGACRVKLGSPKRAKGSHDFDELVMSDDVVETRILGGRLLIRQPSEGYRVNADTLLLAAAVETPGRLLEAGTGVGAVALAVTQRSPETQVLGIERAARMAALARENIAANGMSARVSVLQSDALNLDDGLGTFDGVFFNPPFNDAEEGRAPTEARRPARVAEAPMSAWIGALANRLKGGAALTLIYRAERLGEILAALEGRVGGPEVFPIRPRAEAPAKRVIVRARKGSRAPLRLLRGLDLHDDGGAKHTPEAEAILRGDALISWT